VRGGAVPPGLKDTSLKIIWRNKQQRGKRKKKGERKLLSKQWRQWCTPVDPGACSYNAIRYPANGFTLATG
jgi:hypothetical protein